MKVPRLHVFVCVAKYCKENKSEALYERLRELVKEKKLQDVTVTGSGSVGMCDIGPNIVVYPDGVWYVGVKNEDLPEIVEQHLIKGKPVERLRITPTSPQEVRRKAFYAKTMGKDSIGKDELIKMAAQDGFSLQWVDQQVSTGFLEVVEPAEKNLLKVSGKARGRYSD